MKDDRSLDHMRSVWQDQKEAAQYANRRFSSSRRWRWTDKKEKKLLETILGYFGPNGLGLDAPCGAGRLAPCFQRAGLTWIGVDVSHEMARLARQKVKGPVVTADVTALPFRDGAFEFAVCVRLLHRILEREVRTKILQELSRVSSGPIVVTYYTKWNLRGLQRWFRGKPAGLSRRRIRRELRETGLEISDALPLGWLLHQQWFFVLNKTGPTPGKEVKASTIHPSKGFNPGPRVAGPCW